MADPVPTPEQTKRAMAIARNPRQAREIALSLAREAAEERAECLRLAVWPKTYAEIAAAIRARSDDQGDRHG